VIYNSTNGGAKIVLAGAAQVYIAVLASDVQYVLPAGGAANQILKNAGLAGQVAWGTVTENAGEFDYVTKINTDPVTPTDLTIACGTDKTLVLEEVVWDDLRINPGSFDRPRSSDPSIVTYNVNGGGINTYLYGFALNNIASFTIQLPHSYKEGEDISVHVHWTPGANGAANNGLMVGWKVDYSWASINGIFGTMLTADLSDACDGTNHKHQMTPEVTIAGAGKHLSSMIICNIKRTDTGADDTWTTGLPLILEIDFHFPIDTIGSRQTGIK
jgi:hypothetical protein